MGIFSRLFKVGQSEAHALVDKLEDPIKLTEQGIRDLKKDLKKSLESFAEVKALAIRSKKEVNEYKNQAQNYENKAIQILKKVQSGDIEVAEADRLAGEALKRKEECVSNAARSESDLQQLEGNITQLDNNIKTLKSKISHYESELKTLKARARVNAATKKLNKSLSNIDSNGTISMLEKMKDKVARDEELAQAYGDMADSSRSIDDEINSALDNKDANTSNALEEMKKKLNM